MGLADSKSAEGAKGNAEKPKETQELGVTQHPDRSGSGKSVGSYGATTSRRGSRTGSIVKRISSTPTSTQPFERQASKLSSVASGKSLASIRTRLTSVSRSEYHDDLKPSLSGSLNVNLVFTSFIIVFGSSFLFGYNIGALNQVRDLIKAFYKDTYSERYGSFSDSTVTVLWSLTTALFIPGGMAGAFLGGWLADKLGRKKSILFSHVFSILGAIVSCACLSAKAPEMLMLGRILVGVHSGIGNVIGPMYLTEITPFNLRGAFGTVHQLSITLGIFVSSVFGMEQLMGTEKSWPYLILFEALPSLTSLIILPFLPDSPRYLLLQQRDREGAQKALKFYRRADDVSTDMEEMDTEHMSQPEPDEQTEFTLGQLFTDRCLLRPLLIACALQIVQQFSGINAVFSYSRGIFLDANIDEAHIAFVVIGVNGVNVLMTIIAVPLMDITGRRPLLLYPMLVMIFDLVLITTSLLLQAKYPWMSYLCICSIIIYVICFAVGLGPIPMMIGAELFRQGPRPKAMALAGVVNWVATFVILMSFESVKELCQNYTFLIFLVLMILFLVFVYFFVPETKNKTFEEIAHQFAPGADIEVEEMVDDVFDDAEGLPNEEGDHEDHHLVTINFAVKTREFDENEPPLSPGTDVKERQDGIPLQNVKASAC